MLAGVDAGMVRNVFYKLFLAVIFSCHAHCIAYLLIPEYFNGFVLFGATLLYLKICSKFYRENKLISTTLLELEHNTVLILRKIDRNKHLRQWRYYFIATFGY